MQKKTTLPLVDRLFLYCVVFWGLFLFLQSGNWLDEAEHCNAAWLMGSQGLKPYTDFFQHHSPLLWDFLSLFYRAGGTGVEVLFFGRGMVVFCGLLCAYSFRTLTSSVKGFSSPLIPFAAMFFLFATYTVGFSSTFVIRPETPSLAFGALAMLLWNKKKEAQRPRLVLLFEFLAGVSWGVGIYSSPRLVIASPLFLAFALPGARKEVFRSLAMAAWGVFFGFLGYSLLALHSLSHYLFLISFSRTFQKVGTINGMFALKMGASPPLFGPVLFTGILYGMLYFLAETQNKRRIIFHCIWVGVLSCLAVVLSWPHAYPQNLMPVYFYATFALADIFNRQTWNLGKPFEGFACFFSVWFLAALAASLFSDFNAKADLIKSYQLRKDLLSRIHQGETVLLPYMVHPIAALNASFYGGYQDDGINRTCRAVEASRTALPLPPCSFLDDLLQKRPVLIEATTLAIAVEKTEDAAVKLVMEKAYEFDSRLQEPKNYVFFRLKDKFRKVP